MGAPGRTSSSRRSSRRSANDLRSSCSRSCGVPSAPRRSHLTPPGPKARGSTGLNAQGSMNRQRSGVPPAAGNTMRPAAIWICGRRAAFVEQTRYLDEALHADARHESVAPPLLGSGIRQWMLQRFLRLAAGDRTLDLGCGSGRTLIWNAGSGAAMTGVDISPYFCARSARSLRSPARRSAAAAAARWRVRQSLVVGCLRAPVAAGPARRAHRGASRAAARRRAVRVHARAEERLDCGRRPAREPVRRPVRAGWIDRPAPGTI